MRLIPRLPILFTRPSAMSLRGRRTLSRLFQATVKIVPEKRHSSVLEDIIPTGFEKDSVFEPDFTREQEKIRDYHAKLVFKDGEFLDLELLDPKRRLLYAGKLFRRSDSAFERKGQTEILVLLFDNYLVMAKFVGRRPYKKFQVYKRPIPLDLLALESYDVPVRVKRRSSLFVGRDDATGPYPSTLGAQGTSDAHQGTLPFTITHEGHLGGSYTLYADTEDTRSMWRSKLGEAIQLRQKSSRIFKMKILNRESFLMKTGISRGYLPQGCQFTRTINCATPFTTRDGRSLTAIGCLEGLWIGDMSDPQSFHCILPLQMIRQCTVLEEFEMILILTDNDLCAYDLESCVPSFSGPTTYYPPRKLNSKGDVTFFRVGMIEGDTYVVFSRRKRMDTSFRMLRVVRSVEETSLESPGAKEDWFCVHRDFLLPVHCTDLIFLYRGLVVFHRNGFSMLNLSDFQCVGMPRQSVRNTEQKNLVRRCMSSQSLGMFRLQAETFLLCYDKFGVYVDRHGILLNDRVAVEWEGVAERVSYQHPYVLLFSANFVEVRHAVTGRLEQIARGNSVRCVWEGNDFVAGDLAPGQPSQDPGILGVTIAPAGLDELAVQCIFTLLPSMRSLSPAQTPPLLSPTERPNVRL